MPWEIQEGQLVTFWSLAACRKALIVPTPVKGMNRVLTIMKKKLRFRMASCLSYLVSKASNRMSKSMRRGMKMVLKHRVISVLMYFAIAVLSMKPTCKPLEMLAPAYASMRGVRRPTVRTKSRHNRQQVFKKERVLFLLRSTQIMSVCDGACLRSQISI